VLEEARPNRCKHGDNDLTSREDADDVWIAGFRRLDHHMCEKAGGLFAPEKRAGRRTPQSQARRPRETSRHAV